MYIETLMQQQFYLQLRLRKNVFSKNNFIILVKFDIKCSLIFAIEQISKFLKIDGRQKDILKNMTFLKNRRMHYYKVYLKAIKLLFEAYLIFYRQYSLKKKHEK